MTRQAQRTRLLKAAMGEPYFAPRPVDVTDATQFPNIAGASAYLASLSPERRKQLEEDWL